MTTTVTKHYISRKIFKNKNDLSFERSTDSYDILILKRGKF